MTSDDPVVAVAGRPVAGRMCSRIEVAIAAGAANTSPEPLAAGCAGVTGVIGIALFWRGRVAPDRMVMRGWIYCPVRCGVGYPPGVTRPVW